MWPCRRRGKTIGTQGKIWLGSSWRRWSLKRKQCLEQAMDSCNKDRITGSPSSWEQDGYFPCHLLTGKSLRAFVQSVYWHFLLCARQCVNPCSICPYYPEACSSSCLLLQGLSLFWFKREVKSQHKSCLTNGRKCQIWKLLEFWLCCMDHLGQIIAHLLASAWN